MAKRKMARGQPSGRVDLPLAIEGAQQSRTDFLDPVGKVVQLIAAFAGQPCGWHVEVAREAARHGSVKDSTGRVGLAVLLSFVCPNPLQCLVDGVRVGEDVEGR